MKEKLDHLYDHHLLSRSEAKDLLLDITSGNVNSSHLSALLSVYRMRSITVPELQGFREALLELAIRVDLSQFSPIDMCGTGGDGKDTFNISTLSAFVVAGAGQKVAKHGNYGVSSICGSSNLLEYLGVSLSSDQTRLRQEIEQVGICFLHAPLFHPAMKEVAPVRKDLGLRTFFNILGPLVNPATPLTQCSGVSSLELLRLYSYLLQQDDVKFMIVHSLCGYDEISLTGRFKVFSNKEELVLCPEDLGFSRVDPAALRGGRDIKESADIFLKVLKGEGSEQQSNVVIANAGMAIRTGNPEIKLSEALEMAKESLFSKGAFCVFKSLLELNESYK